MLQYFSYTIYCQKIILKAFAYSFLGVRGLTTLIVLQRPTSLTTTTQLFDLDMYAQCSDGSLSSTEEFHGMQDCSIFEDTDIINMGSAPY